MTTLEKLAKVSNENRPNISGIRTLKLDEVEYAGASDGGVLVLVSGLGEFESKGSFPTEDFIRRWLNFASTDTITRGMREIKSWNQHAKPEKQLCDVCNGDPSSTVEVCDVCDGNGSHNCGACDAEHDCGVCDGEGKTKECRRCIDGFVSCPIVLARLKESEDFWFNISLLMKGINALPDDVQDDEQVMIGLRGEVESAMLYPASRRWIVLVMGLRIATFDDLYKKEALIL